MERLLDSLQARFGERPAQPTETETIGDRLPGLEVLANHASHRAFTDQAVSLELLQLLAAVALSAASKSDLQQRDIIIVRDREVRDRLLATIDDQPWTRKISTLAIFCGNNRRQRQLHALRGHPFVNDHIDAVFNAAVDAGIALQAFITAAERVGLGCCPISALRNHAEDVSEILALPEHVFPVAGLAIGWPAKEPRMSQRLPLSATVHVDRFDDTRIVEQITDYDARRAKAQPMSRQRNIARFGTVDAADYGWSEDKARQYAEPERADFGAYLAARGFRLV